MHIKFLKHGTGSTAKAVDYLMRTHDHKGEVREVINVLRGNPNIVAELGEGLKFKHKYRSAVIAWHKSDKPTAEQMQEVLDDFEKLAYAGLEGDQYSYLAVQHDNHIHIIAPRVELRTGKSYNIAPPGWQKSYDVLRDKFNVKYEWKSPHSSKAITNASKQIEKYQKHSKKEIMEDLNKKLFKAIRADKVKNGNDVKMFFEKQGGIISRHGKNYISVKFEGSKKAIKFEGMMYCKDFEIVSHREAVKEAKAKEASRGKDWRQEEMKRLDKVFAQVCNKWQEVNAKKYPQPTPKPIKKERNELNRDKPKAKESDEPRRRPSEFGNIFKDAYTAKQRDYQAIKRATQKRRYEREYRRYLEQSVEELLRRVDKLIEKVTEVLEKKRIIISPMEERKKKALEIAREVEAEKKPVKKRVKRRSRGRGR